MFDIFLPWASVYLKGVTHNEDLFFDKFDKYSKPWQGLYERLTIWTIKDV